MLYILNGCGEYVIENKIFPISKGKLFYIQPNQVHSLVTDTDKGNSVKTLDIKFRVKEKELEKKIKLFKSEVILEEKDIPLLLKKIRKEGLEKDIYYNEFSVIYLMEIIYIICRKHVDIYRGLKNKKNEKKLETIEHYEECTVNEAFIEHIKKHYMDDLSLKKIAKSLGYNQSYICQQLKKVYKCTPITLLYKFRIKKARELITNTDYSLKQVSELVGFKTVHHFSRKFKEYQGITPGQFRNKERDGIRKNIYFNNNFVNKDITIKNNLN